MKIKGGKIFEIYTKFAGLRNIGPKTIKLAESGTEYAKWREIKSKLKSVNIS